MIIKILKKIKALTLSFFKFFVNNILSFLGYKLLNQAETITYLKKYEVAVYPSPKITLAQTVVYQPEKTVFEASVVEAQVSFVLAVDTSGIPAKQLKSGTIKMNDQVLCTDHNHMGFYKAIINFKKRPTRNTQTLIAPFSQFCDSIYYGGYYDFVFLVLAKLCRIKEAIPAQEFASAMVAYPLFKTPYEMEYLSLLGVAPHAIVDSSVCEVKFSKVIMGNNGHWYYPSIADIQAIKKQVNGSLQITRTKKNRVYISRNTRRNIINEAELIVLLKTFGFVIIEDKHLTVAQQVEIYRNASFIIGPHGASFSNIIWCDPGTQLFELFSPNYMPDFFRYLAAVMEMPYAAYYHGVPNGISFRDALIENIYVSIPDLSACLTAMFESAQTLNLL